MVRVGKEILLARGGRGGGVSSLKNIFTTSRQGSFLLCLFFTFPRCSLTTWLFPRFTCGGVENWHWKNRSVTEDLEAVTKRLRSAEEAHGKEVDEHQRRSNDLQERLVETRAEKAEVSAV